MSYSFSVSAADKFKALEEVKIQMAAVAEGQPVHARDEKWVNETAAGAVALLADDGSKDIELSVYGSLGWSGTSEPGKEELTSVNIGVSAYLNARPEKPAA